MQCSCQGVSFQWISNETFRWLFSFSDRKAETVSGWSGIVLRSRNTGARLDSFFLVIDSSTWTSLVGDATKVQVRYSSSHRTFSQSSHSATTFCRTLLWKAAGMCYDAWSTRLHICLFQTQGLRLSIFMWVDESWSNPMWRASGFLQTCERSILHCFVAQLSLQCWSTTTAIGSSQWVFFYSFPRTVRDVWRLGSRTSSTNSTNTIFKPTTTSSPQKTPIELREEVDSLRSTISVIVFFVRLIVVDQCSTKTTTTSNSTLTELVRQFSHRSFQWFTSIIERWPQYHWTIHPLWVSASVSASHSIIHCIFSLSQPNFTLVRESQRRVEWWNNNNENKQPAEDALVTDSSNSQ